MPVVSRARSLHWAEPDRGRVGILSVPTTPLEELAASGIAAAVLRKMVLPVTRGTPVEEATFLLRIASEVEHAFLLQYLYAAYSLNVTAGTEPLSNSAMPCRTRCASYGRNSAHWFSAALLWRCKSIHRHLRNVDS